MSFCRSKGCKVVVHQTYEMILSSGSQTRAALEWFDSGQVAEFFSNLHLWQLITLQLFSLHKSTVPLLKDLNLFKIILSTQIFASSWLFFYISVKLASCKLRWWFILALAAVAFLILSSIITCLCCPCCCLYNLGKSICDCLFCCCKSSRGSYRRPWNPKVSYCFTE